MRQQHVEMTFGDRHIAGLAGDKPTMMQVGVHVGKTHKIAKSGNVPIAPTAFEITHEWCAVDRGEDLVLTTDPDRSVPVARQLGKLGRRLGAQAADPICGRPHSIALDVCPLLAPEVKRDWIITKGDADVLQDPVHLSLKRFDLLFVQHIVMRDLAPYVRGGGRHVRCRAIAAGSVASGHGSPVFERDFRDPSPDHLADTGNPAASSGLAATRQGRPQAADSRSLCRSSLGLAFTGALAYTRACRRGGNRLRTQYLGQGR